MRKILGLTVAALLVMGLVGGGTWAYFSDTESSTGNILQAGTLDLTLDGGNSDVKIIDTSVDNIYPGASASYSKELKNVGSIAGQLDVAFSAIDNVGLNDGTEFADNTGDIGDCENVTISCYIDVDQSGTWNAGDIDLEPSGDAVPYGTDSALDSGTINSYGTNTWTNVYAGTMASDTTDNFTISWAVTTGAGNDIQGDSASWDISFTLQQP